MKNADRIYKDNELLTLGLQVQTLTEKLLEAETKVQQLEMLLCGNLSCDETMYASIYDKAMIAKLRKENDQLRSERESK